MTDTPLEPDPAQTSAPTASRKTLRIGLVAVVTLVAWHCWPVLRKSLDRGSRANTPLETPLWIPQSLWFSGWVWFALSSILLLAIGIAYLMSARQDAFDSAIGLGSELDDAIEEARLAHEERA